MQIQKDGFISNSMRHVLNKAINSLPENQKQVITLHYKEEIEKSVNEIAKLLNITHQTAAYFEIRGL